jgi:hypothetical protein
MASTPVDVFRPSVSPSGSALGGGRPGGLAAGLWSALLLEAELERKQGLVIENLLKKFLRYFFFSL